MTTRPSRRSPAFRISLAVAQPVVTNLQMRYLQMAILPHNTFMTDTGGP
uniref:Uncharacterized protein n=1 Tax=Anopheles atroparvus TaxID=41427 RepID=A0AAG5D2T3_ANOAO